MGVPPVFSVSSDTGGTPVPLCAFLHRKERFSKKGLAGGAEVY
jgi:hypothetical protein